MTDKQDKNLEQAIMRAAEELFLSQGFDRTSTVEIARLAGCNQSLVHYYFRSKKNLFGLVFRKKAESFIGSLMKINIEDIPFEDKMRRRISAHFDFIRNNWRLPVLFFNEIITNKELITGIVENFTNTPIPAFKILQSELDEQFEKGNICKTEALDLIFRVFSLNIMTFMLSPMYQMITKTDDEQLNYLLEQRREENIQTIMRTLKP